MALELHLNQFQSGSPNIYARIRLKRGRSPDTQRMMQRQRSALGALLAFAQDELQDLKPKRLGEVRKTIADVAGQVGRADAVARVSGVLRRQEWVEEIEEELPWGDNSTREVTCEVLGDLQTTLNECLAALFPVGGFGDAPGGSAHLPVDLPVHMEHIHIQRGNAGAAAPVEILVPHTNVCTIQPQQVGRAVGRGCGCARAS